MSSTYSDNLRIELIGPGEQSGTWGTTTDNNLAYLLDTAIAGALTVSISTTPQALTAVQGAISSSSTLNQSIYATLKLVSAPSAFTLYAPPSAKQYIIWNATSYVATVGNATALNGTTSTGGATITIAAGETALVWSDATNFYKFVPVLATNATNATNATTATNATNLLTTNFTIQESGGKLVFKYGATTIASMDSSGNIVSAANVSAYGTP
jgi:hypothetical protein